MNHIVALSGVGNSGKTTTINEVFTLLQSKYPAAITNIIIQRVDIKVIMTINGKKVGIESQGDPNSRLEKSLACFVNANCDVIICATRTSGMTVDWVNNYKSTHKIDFISKSRVPQSQQAAQNSQSAQQIISTAGL